MNQNHQTPDPTPTPEQITAWVEGELPPADAGFVAAWLAAHPEAVREAESIAQITRLYREQAAPMPGENRWRSSLTAIEQRVALARAASLRRRLLLGFLIASAAVLGGVVLARSLWPTTPPLAPIAEKTPILVQPEEDEEPFAVARSSEVHIIGMDADDADRVVTGQPLMGSMDFAGQGDIDVVAVEPDPDDGCVPRLERRAGLPWIVLAKTNDEVMP